MAKKVRNAFVMGGERTFDEDPRYSLVVLAQIGSRAMSPAVNDPGTVIDIIAAQVRLFYLWCEPSPDVEHPPRVSYPRVAVPRLSLTAMFEDAFGAMGRECAGNVEVAVRLQAALASLAGLDHPGVALAARQQAALALARAEDALRVEHDLNAVRKASIAS